MARNFEFERQIKEEIDIWMTIASNIFCNLNRKLDFVFLPNQFFVVMEDQQVSKVIS